MGAKFPEQPQAAFQPWLPGHQLPDTQYEYRVVRVCQWYRVDRKYLGFLWLPISTELFSTPRDVIAFIREHDEAHAKSTVVAQSKK